jgi:L-rhamnose 1-dehydrogenase
MTGRVAIVTGAASDLGMGRAIADAYVAEGGRVAYVDVDEAACADAVALVVENAADAIAVTADVSDPEQVDAAVAQTVDAFGRVDVLVNNAGVVRFAPLLELSHEEWDRTMAINLKGYFLFSQAVARQLVRQGGGGCIVNISSISAETAGEWKVHYCASKAGVKLLTEGCALEWAEHAIRVNAIAPGDIATNIVKDDYIEQLVEQISYSEAVPLGRVGAAEDVVGAALFLASDEAAYITGATIKVDGGITAGGRFPRPEDA